jgi:membrane protein
MNNYIEVWGLSCLTLFIAFLINILTGKRIYKEIFSEKKDIIKHILITFISTLIISCLILKLLLYFNIEERTNYIIILNAGISLSLYSAIEILFTDLKTYKANRWLLRYNTLLLLLFNIIINFDKELILLFITGVIIFALSFKFEDIGMSDWRAMYIGYLLFSLVNIYHSIISLALILLVLDVIRRKYKIEAISGFILLPSILITFLYYIIISNL